MKNIAIIGSGTWGVALAIHLSRMGNKIKIWSFSEEEANTLNTERKCKFLPEAVIDENITCYTDMKTVIDGSDIILHVTPSKFVRETIKKYETYVTNQPVIMCSKGFEADTLCTLSQVIEQEMPNVKYGIFSGPSHAEEVSLGIPTAIVIASKDVEIQDMVQQLFMNEKMRVYTSDDVTGVELGGALKNIIAFCAGIATEINLGDNTFAALVSRGLVEITRLGMAMGGRHDTFYGLSGLGDLIVTCMSEHSRNRRAGRLIGKGYTIEEAKKEIGMVIESIDNIEVAYKLSKKYNIEMPIVNAVYDILYNGLEPSKAVTILMTRDKKSE
ncbi:MAG: NAD(P)H-dependent glycerol-3-phosphate dehydrogenase [Clostridia bacterium]